MQYDSSSSVQSTFMFISDTSIEMDNCTFTGAATSDGAIYVDAETDKLEMTDCTFTDNYGEVAGAMYLRTESVLSGCTFTNNTNTIYMIGSTEVTMSSI